MSVYEERDRKHFNPVRKNNELLVIEPPRSLFKVVVNNYRKQEKHFDDQKKVVVETTMNDLQGLPPQPAGYLKFPEYDWF